MSSTNNIEKIDDWSKIIPLLIKMDGLSDSIDEINDKLDRILNGYTLEYVRDFVNSNWRIYGYYNAYDSTGSSDNNLYLYETDSKNIYKWDGVGAFTVVTTVAGDIGRNISDIRLYYSGNKYVVLYNDSNDLDKSKMSSTTTATGWNILDLSSIINYKVTVECIGYNPPGGTFGTRYMCGTNNHMCVLYRYAPESGQTYTLLTYINNVYNASMISYKNNIYIFTDDCVYRYNAQNNTLTTVLNTTTYLYPNKYNMTATDSKLYYVGNTGNLLIYDGTNWVNIENQFEYNDIRYFSILHIMNDVYIFHTDETGYDQKVYKLRKIV